MNSPYSPPKTSQKTPVPDPMGQTAPELTSHPNRLWSPLDRALGPDDPHEKHSNNSAALVDMLKQNRLFSTLNRRDLYYLSQFVFERLYQPGEFIFHQGQRGFGMYVIVSGRIHIRTESPSGEHWLTPLEPGTFFGELSLIDPDNIRSASAIAQERSVLIGFFKPDLMDLIERKPSMGVKILLSLAAVLGQRLVESTEKINLMTRNQSLGRLNEDL